MKLKELQPKSSLKKARKIAALAKDAAKENDPTENEERGGWGVDPHQGAYPSNKPRLQS